RRPCRAAISTAQQDPAPPDRQRGLALRGQRDGAQLSLGACGHRRPRRAAIKAAQDGAARPHCQRRLASAGGPATEERPAFSPETAGDHVAPPSVLRRMVSPKPTVSVVSPSPDSATEWTE